MDKVLRIAKQYSDRVLLAEGKATENIGVRIKGKRRVGLEQNSA